MKTILSRQNLVRKICLPSLIEAIYLFFDAVEYLARTQQPTIKPSEVEDTICELIDDIARSAVERDKRDHSARIRTKAPSSRDSDEGTPPHDKTLLQVQHLPGPEDVFLYSVGVKVFFLLFAFKN